MSRSSIFKLSRRALVASVAAAPFAFQKWRFPMEAAQARAADNLMFRPEDYGALGDGRTNDTIAFAAMSRAVERAGGGTIQLSARTYVIGMQRHDAAGHDTWEPLPVIALAHLARGVTIAGNGAVLRAAVASRFGSFDHSSGKPIRPKMPHYDVDTIATPYKYMILVQNSGGPVVIRDLELDGNIAAMEIGGEWGDTGRQIAMSGIYLRDNAADERLSNIYSHHHGQDGIILDGPDRTNVALRTLDRVRCEYNGRQGCSVVGGRGYHFTNCDFSRSGRAAVFSAPGAGVDIEAERDKRVRGLRFSNCRFEDNAGCGLLADQGDSADVVISGSIMVGTTAWSAWTRKPGFRFEKCKFVGAIVNAFGSDDAAQATHFVDCSFTDDLAQAGHRPVYGGDGSVPIVDLGGSFGSGRNVSFVRCRFVLNYGGRLPWTVGTIFQDVTMTQKSRTVAYPRGIYRGVSTINAPVDLYSSRVEGTLTVNGHPLRM